MGLIYSDKRNGSIIVSSAGTDCMDRIPHITFDNCPIKVKCKISPKIKTLIIRITPGLSEATVQSLTVSLRREIVKATSKRASDKATTVKLTARLCAEASSLVLFIRIN